MRKYSEYLWILAVTAIVLLIIIWVAMLMNSAVSTYSAYVQEQRMRYIIIDAGHGGEDGGAVSCTGVYESKINLEISLRLDDLLHFLGYPTLMIRTEDISVYTKGNTIAEKKISDLKERVRIINDTENATLISIHQNYFQDSRYSGAQVFYAENSSAFAQLVQSQFSATLNQGSHRKIKKAKGIYLMDHIQCTGILIECGFLSNEVEEAQLRSAEYQKKICCVIASSAAQYINSLDTA